MVMRRGLEPTATHWVCASAGYLCALCECVGLRSGAFCGVSLPPTLLDTSETSNTKERVTSFTLFFSKLWSCQQPLGATVASVTNGRWVWQGRG